MILFNMLIKYNNIMNPPQPMTLLLWLIIILKISCDPTSNFVVTPTSYTIQDTTRYKFSITLTGIDLANFTIPAGSTLFIYFPQQYPLLPAQNLACAIIAWPSTYSSISCTLTYQTLTIQNAFSTALTIQLSEIYTLEWIVNGVQNPQYSLTTSSFSGEIRSGSGVTIYPTTQLQTNQGIIINPGILTVSMSAWPTAADSTSNLTITVYPAHAIPASGYLLIIFTAYWVNSVFQNNILNAQTACLPINVVFCLKQNSTANNLGCTYIPVLTDFQVTVTNIFNTASSAPFSFNITGFLNPPSTQPEGNFIFKTYNTTDSTVTPSIIDSSSNNFVSGITPSSILSPSLLLSQYQQGTEVQANLTVTITNVIQTTDSIYLTAPSPIDLRSVRTISIAGVAATIVSTSMSLVVFKNSFQLANPNPVTIVINTILLPPYSITITSPFTIYIVRNSYYICTMSSSFSIVLTPGLLNVTLIPATTQAGITTSYNMSMNFSHALDPNSQISFYFSPTYFTIGSSVSCTSSVSTNCTILSSASNLVTVTWISLSSTTSADIILNDITNPSAIGSFTPVLISTYNVVNGYLVDYNQNSAYFTLTSRAMALTDTNITSTSYFVYALATYTFSIRNNNNLPANSSIVIYVPSQVTFSSVVCSVVCAAGLNSGIQQIIMQQIGPLNAGSISTLTIQNMVNPSSTRPTSVFSISILNSNGQLLEFLINGPTFTAVNPSNMAMNIVRSSLQNSASCLYTITFSTSYIITGQVAVLLVVPSTQTCPSCTSLSYNSSSNQMVFYSQTMLDNKLVLSLANFTNFYSYQTQYITGTIMSNDLLYISATASTSLTNSLPSVPSLVYSFTVLQLASSSALVISKITSQAIASSVGSIVLAFGSDFNLASINCTNPGYTCSQISNQITFAVAIPGVLSQITVNNITTPNLSPSTFVSFSTYSISGSLIDQSSVIQWSANCQLPCKTCLLGNSSYCQSCYSDINIAQGRVLYFGLNNTCVSQCGDKYYHNYTINACQACSTSCYNCYNGTFCLSCPNNYYLLNNTCYSLCPNGYFPHSTQCLACTTSLNCYTCANELVCASCFTPYFMYQMQCTSCPLNTTIANTTTHTCDACPSNCSTCYLSTTNTRICTACSSGLLDAGLCVQSCVTFGNVPNGLVCSSCDANCLTCQGSTTYCLTCNTSSVNRYFLGNKCYAQCPLTYYNDINSNSCLRCTSPCQTCTGFFSTACASCLSGYSLIGSVCNSSCPSQYYSNTTSCQPCISPCLTCFSSMLCFTCVANYSLFSSNYTCLSQCPAGYITISQTCQACSSNCLTCSTQTTCLTCPNNTYLYNSTCLNPCPTSDYPNVTLGQCQACPYSCSTCVNSSYCTKCQSGYQLQSNFSCISLCPTNQIPISSICINCTATCSSCQQSVTNCTACIAGYFYSPTLFACYSACPVSLYLYTSSGTCITACPSPSYTTLNSTNNVSTCFACPAYCSSCVSSTQCPTCLSGFYFYDSFCYLNCPGIAPYRFGSKCYSCNVVDCLTCNNTICTLCASGKLLIGGSLCLSSCSSNQVYNPVNLTCDTVTSVISDPSSSTIQAIAGKTTTLNFIPFPFFIAFALASIFVFILHFRNKLSAIPTFYGIIGPIVTFCNLTVIIVGFSSSSITTSIATAAVYCLVVYQILIFIGSLICIILWYRYAKFQKWGVIVVSGFHYSVFALLTANFSQYNSYFIEEHKSFWRRYKFLSKLFIIIAPLGVIGGILLCFAVNDMYTYLFFGGIQISLLTFIGLVLQILWIWIPIKEPIQQQEVISEKSTQIILGSEVDKESQKDNNYNNYQQNRVRISDIKTDGDNNRVEQEKEIRQTKSNYETNQINQVIRIQADKIPEGLQKGLFRKNQDQILKQIKQGEVLSNLDSAPKMNKYLSKNEQKQPIDVKISQQKEDFNIFQKDQTELSQSNLFQDAPPKDRINSPKYVQSKAIDQNYDETPLQLPKDLTYEDIDSGQATLYDEPIQTKQMDFKHNIIFEDIQEDNVTFYDQQKQQKPSTPAYQPLVKDSSLGEIINPNPTVIKVQSAYNNQERGFSPNFDQRSKRPQKITVEEFEDNFIQSRIQLFNINSNKIRPNFSKQLSRKSSMQHRVSKEIKKEQRSKEIIHADFEQIISVGEGGSLQYLDEDDYMEREVQKQIDSGKKLRQNMEDNVDKIIRYKGVDKPGDFFRQASVHYQPMIQKNVPPPQSKPLPNRRQRK